MNFVPPQNFRSALEPAVLGNVGRLQSPKSEHDQLVDKTRTWVAQTFFGTLLKQMRNSPFKSDLFSGGQGGQTFASLHDQHLAEHMTRGAGSKLVNGIVRRIEANAAYRRHAVREGGRADDRRADDRPNRNPRDQRSHVASARGS